MIINAVSQAFSLGRMLVNGRQVDGVDSLGSGLVVNSVSGAEAESASGKKTSIYDNFAKEMSRRLANPLNKTDRNAEDAPDPSILVQSLTGAMGEIEQLFGREAATEVMAKILTGAADGVAEESLLSSIQNSLAGLSHFDPNGAKMKRLTDGFNRDLTLALEPKLAGKKLENKETVSLGYAIAKHFNSLITPEETEDNSGKPCEMSGFDETGRWDTVEVAKLDEASAEELKEAAEAGIDKATELTMADVMEKVSGENLFQDFVNFLKKDLQDKESALFVEQGLTDSYFMVANKYGSSPKIAEVISQVYSKVAADGDADKLALLENYLNTDFKEALNPILAEMQQGGYAVLLPGAEVGELQFKGLTGASLAGENDVFSLNWGYKDDNTYDRSTSKRFLQEDIRGVKAVKEKQDESEQRLMAENWDETAEEKRLRKIKESKADQRAGLGLSNRANSDGGQINPEEADIRTTLGERFAKERRQKKLEEALTIKFGQLSDSSREELGQYLKDNFSEEEAEKLQEHTKWSNDLMSGLAAIHRDIRESGAGEAKAREFMNFLNSTMKQEVEKVTDELGGLEFDGWQALDGLAGELEASFRFTGQDQTTRVTILGPERVAPAAADREAQVAAPRPPQRFSAPGCLIDLMA
jgi:hypothetical protein